jgi:hypothetical protein
MKKSRRLTRLRNHLTRMISRRCGGRVVGCIGFRSWRLVDGDRDGEGVLYRI